MKDELEVLREEIYGEIDLSHVMTDKELENLIEQQLIKRSRRYALSLDQREQYGREVFNSMRKLDVLQELLEDEEITEVMVNGRNHIFYEKAGTLQAWDRKFASEEKLSDVIQQMVGHNNRRVNASTPIADTRLPDGSRVNIVLSPVAVDGSCISIRKFPKEALTMSRLTELGSLNKELAEYLGLLVESGYNIFISGGTGSGKTTFLNALSGYIPAEERLITIEDSAELQIRGIPNLVRLEMRNRGSEGTEEISIRDLIRTALRMRPDRIIVGECRGAEALDMLQAMNTGHDGSLSTGHANSGRDMLSRLETMVLMGMELPVGAIRGQIAAGIDILIHLGRLRDKSRKVLEVAELDGVSEGEICLRLLGRFEESREEKGMVSGRWCVKKRLKHREKLLAAGLAAEFEQLEQRMERERGEAVEEEQIKKERGHKGSGSKL